MNVLKKKIKVIVVSLIVLGVVLFTLQSLRSNQVWKAYTFWWQYLQTQDYDRLYQTLPDEVRARTSQAEFSKSYSRFRNESYEPERVLKIRVYWTEARVLFRPEGTFGESLTMKKGATGWWLEDVNGFWTTTPFE